MQYLRMTATTVNTHDNVKDVCISVISNNLHTYNMDMFNGRFMINATTVSVIDSFHAD